MAKPTWPFRLAQILGEPVGLVDAECSLSGRHLSEIAFRKLETGFVDNFFNKFASTGLLIGYWLHLVRCSPAVGFSRALARCRWYS